MKHYLNNYTVGMIAVVVYIIISIIRICVFDLFFGRGLFDITSLILLSVGNVIQNMGIVLVFFVGIIFVIYSHTKIYKSRYENVSKIKSFVHFFLGVLTMAVVMIIFFVSNFRMDIL